jgi:hypothetical protein
MHLQAFIVWCFFLCRVTYYLTETHSMFLLLMLFLLYTCLPKFSLSGCLQKNGTYFINWVFSCPLFPFRVHDQELIVCIQRVGRNQIGLEINV